MTMIKAIIADDERHARERLKDLLNELALFDIIGEASSGNEALEMIVAKRPDVAFLDINMPGISVFDTVSSLNNPPLIVFQTAYSEYASDAFNVNAIDYLMKPLSRERLNRAVKKIQERLLTDGHPRADNTRPQQQKTDSISIRDKGAIKIISILDIQKICFEDGLSFIYSSDKKYISDKTLKHYEDILKARGFFRSSKTDLVNLDFIEVIHPMFNGSYIIEMKDKSRVDLSRRKSRLLRKIIDF